MAAASLARSHGKEALSPEELAGAVVPFSRVGVYYFSPGLAALGSADDEGNALCPPLL